RWCDGASVIHVHRTAGHEARSVWEDEAQSGDSSTARILTAQAKDVAIGQERGIESGRILTLDDSRATHSGLVEAHEAALRAKRVQGEFVGKGSQRTGDGQRSSVVAIHLVGSANREGGRWSVKVVYVLFACGKVTASVGSK